MVQRYQPVRKGLLSKVQLEELCKLTPRKVIVDTLVSWLVIWLSWLTVPFIKNNLYYFMVFLLVGLSFHRLYIIGHDGLHRRLFNSRLINDLWNDIFVMCYLGASTGSNCRNHLLHHVHTCGSDDPDRYKYISSNKDSTLKFLSFYSGWGTLIKSLKNVYSSNKSPIRKSSSNNRFKDIMLILTLNIGLFLFHWMYIGPWSFLLLWLAPIYCMVYIGDLLRVFCEHNMPLSEQEADLKMRLITHTPSNLERAFFSPLNMNFHSEHHLWTAIPYYNLPNAHAIICNDPLYKEHVIIRESYVGYILQFLKKNRL